MKTLACLLTTWVTATALLIWVVTRHSNQIDFVSGMQITLTTQQHSGHIFWHSLWVAGVFSILNTFIVRFWQMQWELREKQQG